MTYLLAIFTEIGYNFREYTKAGGMRVETLKNLFQTIAYSIPNIGVTDIIDIALVAFAIYKLIGMLRHTTASRVAKGILILIASTMLARALQLNAVTFILERVLELGVVALVIVFQPELRRFLERMGSRKISQILAPKDKQTEMETSIEAVVNACEILSRDRVGALIVFERGVQLGDFFKTGTVLDAKISVQLLRSVFFPKAALHDGAVILRQGRLVAAGCVLPLTENAHISTDLGTRHRAGIGMSEVSDAVVVIVSEETGTVSVAVGGMEQEETLLEKLKKFLKAGGSKNAEK